MISFGVLDDSMLLITFLMLLYLNTIIIDMIAKPNKNMEKLMKVISFVTDRIGN